MKRLPMKKFFKAILLTLSILIVLQDVSYALSPTSRFRPITDSEEQLSQPYAAPDQSETVFPSASDVLKPQKEPDSDLRKNQGTKPIVRMNGQIRPRILIVEDKKVWREKYKELLNKWGYEPEFAEYGRKAVEIFKENPAGFALVISDLDLNEELPEGVKDMPGEEVISEVRKIHAKIPIIVISARNYTGDLELINYDPILKPRFEAKPEIILEVLKECFHILPAANKPPKDKPEEKRNVLGLVKDFLLSPLYRGEVSDLIRSLNIYRSADCHVIGRDAAWKLSEIIINNQNNYYIRKKALYALLTALKVPWAYGHYYYTIASCLGDIAKKDHNLAPTVISTLETILKNPELYSDTDAYTTAANTFSSLVVNNLIEPGASLDIYKIIYKSKKIEKSYIGAVANALAYIALNSMDQKLVQGAVDLLKIALETSPSAGEIRALTSIIQDIPDQGLSRGGIDALEWILKKKNLHSDVYRVTIESINSIAENKPELITSATVSALSTVLKDLRLYRFYGIYIDAADCLYSIARNTQYGDLSKEVITVLENILKAPGLYLCPDAYWLDGKKTSYIAQSIPNSVHPSVYWAAAANLSLIANNAKDQVLAYQALSVLVSAISVSDLDSVIYEAAAHYLTQIKPELISSKKEEIYSVVLKRISTTDRWLIYAAMLNLLNALGYETKNFSHPLDVYFPNATEKIQKDFADIVENINHKYNNIIRVITVEECSFTKKTIMFGSDIDHLVIYYEKGRRGDEIIAAASDFARGLRNIGIEKGHDDYGGWVEESLERTGHREIIIYNKGEINHSKEGVLDKGAKTEAREKLFNVFNSGLSPEEIDLLRRIHGLGAIQELSGCRFVDSTLFLTKKTDTEVLEKLEERGIISTKAPGITTIWNAGEGSGVIIAYRVVGLQSAFVPLDRSQFLKSVEAEDSRDLKPFFEKHKLGFQNIAAVIVAVSELKDLIAVKKAREGAIYTEIGKLNKTFRNGEIEIKRKIETVAFKCSGKEYKYAVFHFKKEDKTINVLFLEDHAALTPAELAELNIQDIENRRLDCPGLEGVWFINSDTANAKSAAEFEKLPSRDALEKEINRIHNENFKYIPDIPEKTILCHIIVDSILPEGQRAMLKTLEQNMRDQSYSEKVVSLTVNKPESFIDQLRALMARQRELYKDYTVNFDVACPNTDLVTAILGANLGIKALAFEPCKEADVAQVEGIILALRALNSGNIETLREAFKILTGKELPQGLSVISDIDELIKRITFILPAAKVIDYSHIRRLNEIIRKNIEAAA